MKEENQKKAPVVVIMGHIDHGKSTLLDYIRKSNVVEKEAGGITQHIAAYEVTHKDDTGNMRNITFLDTPGHEAFSSMRVRGAQTADIAILVVSAEDSVKAQTIEAWQTIQEAKLPAIVAINKIDKPNANVEKTKLDLSEKGIYLEGYGGDVPFCLISAKTGDGITDLLDLILLVSDLHNFEAKVSGPATGVVIESNLDPKRGISATLIVKEGTLKKGMFVVAGNALATTRIMENFLGKQTDCFGPSEPLRIVGFSDIPETGSVFTSYEKKKDAEEALHKEILDKKKDTPSSVQVSNDEVLYVPIIIKTDTVGTGEAVVKELKKAEQETIKCKIISIGVGSISENDIKLASSDKQSIILGFHVGLDPRAVDINESAQVKIKTSDIIYQLTEFLTEEFEKRRPRKMTTTVTGRFKVLKIFSASKDKQVIGGKVLEGMIAVKNQIRIIRREFEIGKGFIDEMQLNKLKVKSVEAENECGMQVESKFEVAPGDVLEAFTQEEI